MKKVKKVINVFSGHTLEEYKSLYDIDKTIHIDKETIDKFNKKHPKAKKNSPLEGRSWWLIDDTYYEINPLLKKPVGVYKSKARLKIVIASIVGAIALGGVGYGSYYIIKKAWKDTPEPTKEKWYTFDDWYKRTSNATTEDIGVECKIKVNDVDHVVRLIGIDEDVDDNNNKIHTTWEFKNTISDSNGYGLGTIYNDCGADITVDPPYNIYEDSSVRKALTGSGDGKIYWTEKGETTFSTTYGNKTVLQMINKTEIKDCLKSAKKVVASYESGNYFQKEITDKLFLPSAKELGLDATYAIEPHDPYSFYKDAEDKKRYKKHHNCNESIAESLSPSIVDSTYLGKTNILNHAGTNLEIGENTKGTKYWLRSTEINFRDYAYYIYFDGTLYDYSIYGQAIQVAPLFFI